MTILTPDDQFMTDVVFTSPYMDGVTLAFLAIIAENPVDDLFLNDVNLQVRKTFLVL